MLTTGGQRTAAGTYWNIMNGERIELEHDTVLPGGGNDRYLKAPALLAISTGPGVGLVFAVLLPFFAIGMALMLLGRAIVQGMVNGAMSVVVFGWRPIESYLAGRKMKRIEREKRGGKK